MTGQARLGTAVAFVAGLMLALPASAAKTDIVILKNGDRITGEFKKIERGQLEWSTDSMGTVSIEWKDVASLESTFRLQAELASGQRYVGFARAGDGPGRIKLVEEQGAEQGDNLLMDRIVRVARLDEGSIADRFDGYVSFGYDYANASDVTKLNADAGIRARRAKFAWNVDASVRLTDTAAEPRSQRANLGAGYSRFLRDRWFRRYVVSVERNDELGLKLRTLVGAGGGKYLVQTNSYEWSTLAGLALNQEEFEEASPAENVELLLGTDFSWYVFDTPKTDVSTKLFILPNLTDSGRYRGQADVRARRELVSDLFFELSFYGTYDSRPGETAAGDFDYGITTSLGYEF